MNDVSRLWTLNQVKHVLTNML